MHVFPSMLVGTDNQIPIIVLTDARLTCKYSTSSTAICPLVKDVYRTIPLVSEEHQLWHEKILLQLEVSHVQIPNGIGEYRLGFVRKIRHMRVNIAAGRAVGINVGIHNIRWEPRGIENQSGD